MALCDIGAGYVSVRTVQRWHARYGLPLRKRPGVGGQVSADVSELAAWYDRFSRPLSRLRIA